MTTGKTIALTRQTFAGKVMPLLFNTLSRLVITFLPRSKRLLISWLQSPSAVILEPLKIKSVTVSTVSPSISYEVMGPDAMILVFWILSFKPTFSLSSFTFIKRLLMCLYVHRCVCVCVCVCIYGGGRERESLPWWLSGKESTCQCRRQVRSPGQEDPEDPLEKEMATHCNILIFLPGKSHGQKSLAGYIPWVARVGHELATKQHTHTHIYV